jgi:glycosyltransferase involved in cell wall biosynthesis
MKLLRRAKRYLQGQLSLSTQLFLRASLARLSHPFAGAVNIRDHHDRDTPGLEILVCDDHVPSPNRDAGGVRMFLILQMLLKLGRPVFISLSKLPQPEHERQLRAAGIETASWMDYKRVLKARHFDVALLSRPAVAGALVKTIRKISPDTKIIFDTVDLPFIRLGREYKLTGDKETARAAERSLLLETELARACEQVWCVTHDDEAALSAFAPAANFAVIPTIHASQKRTKGFAERRGLVFIGNYLHRPNADAVNYFIREILPLVRAACPEVQLYVVGDNVPPEIASQASDAVIVTGYLAEVVEIFQNSRVFVAPLRFGSGIKGKIGQALSFGVPVVTTSIGAEGMGMEDGCQALIADDAGRFADAVISLYLDPALWQRLSDNGIQHVRENFTPEVVEEKVKRAVLGLMA